MTYFGTGFKKNRKSITTLLILEKKSWALTGIIYLTLREVSKVKTTIWGLLNVNSPYKHINSRITLLYG